MAKKKQGKMSKADAVRKALAAGVDLPQEASKYIQEKFGVAIAPQVFSTYKSQEKIRVERKAASSPRGRRAAKRSDNGVVSIEMVTKVKALVNEYGAESVQEIAAILAK
jgi:hypothetical protein